MNRSLLLFTCLILGASVLLCADASAQQEPGWSPVVIPTGAYREAIKSMPIELRPYRPFHFYGNTIRRNYYHGAPYAGGGNLPSGFGAAYPAPVTSMRPAMPWQPLSPVVPVQAMAPVQAVVPVRAYYRSVPMQPISRQVWRGPATYVPAYGSMTSRPLWMPR